MVFITTVLMVLAIPFVTEDFSCTFLTEHFWRKQCDKVNKPILVSFSIALFTVDFYNFINCNFFNLSKMEFISETCLYAADSNPNSIIVSTFDSKRNKVIFI